jgi:hypothetical protein
VNSNFIKDVITFLALGFELSALHLLGQCCTTLSLSVSQDVSIKVTSEQRPEGSKGVDQGNTLREDCVDQRGP